MVILMESRISREENRLRSRKISSYWPWAPGFSCTWSFTSPEIFRYWDNKSPFWLKLAWIEFVICATGSPSWDPLLQVWTASPKLQKQHAICVQAPSLCWPYIFSFLALLSPCPLRYWVIHPNVYLTGAQNWINLDWLINCNIRF